MMEFGEILISIIAFVSLYTSIFFIITLIEHRNNITKGEHPKKHPLVCIIVPCFNEESTVAKTIDSLLGLDYPMKKLEIIVVDDGSTDNTYKVAKQYESKGVKVFRKKNGGKYTALNLGLSKTKAEFVGALDADSFVDPKALKRMLPYFDNPKVMAVTPSLKIYNAKSWIQRIQRVEYALGIFFRKMYSLIGSINVTPGPFSIYRKVFFEKHGYYKKAHLTEDIEMALRIQTHHYWIENSVNAYVHTVGPSTFKDLYNQRKRWYSGFLKNTIDYKNIFSRKQGNLGLYTMPLALISIAILIVSFFYMLYKFGESLWNMYIYARAVEFDIFRFDLSFDLFMLNINTVLILGAVTLIIGVILIIIAAKLSKEHDKMVFSYIMYVIAYGFLFAFWWLVVLINSSAKKEVKWTPKKTISKKTLS
ncbi:MAG: glycosyltransferase [Nanoarchaeota archaeon]|nr:glycosyltransferase [Nanoarchaeota archaeon]